jgi:hypothetical protein
MSRKLIALDLALVALLGWAAYGLHNMWLAARARETAGLHHKVGSVPVAPLTPLANPPAVVPTQYKGIADKDLWSKDRNPDVPVEPPPPPPPEPPMPALPVYHGIMNLGDGPMAFMSVNASSPYETIRPGDTIGQFKLVSVNTKEIQLEWHGKTVTKSVDELLDNSQTAQQPAQQAAADTRTAAPASVVNQPQEAPSPKGPGEVNQYGTAPCLPNDNTPYGTVRDGFRKVERVTPFARVCLWEQLGSGK